MQKKYIEIFLSVAFIALSVLLYKSTESFNASSIVTTSSYIKFLALCLGLCAFYELVVNIFKKSDEKVEFAKNLKRFLLLIFLLIGYVFILDYLGFIISSFIFLPLTMIFMGYKKIVLSFVYSACVIAFVYLLFSKIFEIPLPEFVLFGS